MGYRFLLNKWSTPDVLTLNTGMICKDAAVELVLSAVFLTLPKSLGLPSGLPYKLLMELARTRTFGRNHLSLPQISQIT